MRDGRVNGAISEEYIRKKTKEKEEEEKDRRRDHHHLLAVMTISPSLPDCENVFSHPKPTHAHGDS